MPEGRSHIPAQMKRDLLIETGYRCAMPTCRETTVDFCHIVPWSTVKTHDFSNIIVLCPIHRRMFDVEKKIDRKAILQIKANLSLMNHRYGELERRFMLAFFRNGLHGSHALPAMMQILVQNLVDDHIIFDTGRRLNLPARVDGITLWALTEHGRDFVERWASGIDLAQA